MYPNYHQSKNFQKTTIILALIILGASATMATTTNINVNQLEILLPYRHPSLKRDCANPLHASTCFSTLRRLLLSGITQASSFLSDSFFHQFTEQNSPKSLPECLEMMHQTSYELHQAKIELNSPLYSQRSNTNLKSILSAAITNGHTCTSETPPPHIHTSLTSLSHLLLDCLSAIAYAESFQTIQEDPEMEFLPWLEDHQQQMLVRGASPHLGADAVVAKDGTGNCTTITQAVEMAPNWGKNSFLIKIKAGFYQENVVIQREKLNIVMVGEGSENTVIIGNRSFIDGFSTFNSATLTVVGDRFVGRGLGVMNTAGPGKHQAVAARVTSNAAFYWCRFSSYQDTLYVHSLRQMYTDCTVEGTVDFIFGNAEAVFHRCTILVRRPLQGQTNVITAQGRENPYESTGIWLHNCSIEAAPGFSPNSVSTFIGRPWRNFSRTVVVGSYIGEVVHPEGWCRWDRYTDVESLEYVECMNYGPGSDLRGRVRWPGYSSDCRKAGRREGFEGRVFSYGGYLHLYG